MHQYTIKNLWKAISHIGVHDDLNEQQAMRVKLTGRICFISMLTLFSYLILELVQGIYALVWPVLISELLLITAFFLLNKRLYLIAKVILFFCIAGSISFFTIIIGGDANGYILFAPLATMPFLVFDSKKLAKTFVFIIVVLFVVTYILLGKIQAFVIFTDDLYLFFSIVNMVIIILITSVVVYVFRNLNETYGRSILEQKKIIESKNDEILDSINYAQRIQKALLPPLTNIRLQFPDAMLLYKPKDVVAGDFYWCETMGNITMIAAADCTGHGVPGAMVSVVCHNALNRSLREYGLTDPGAILDKTKSIVIEEFEQSEQQVKDGMDISLVSFDHEQNMLQWSGANNPLWILPSDEHHDELIEKLGDKKRVSTFRSSEAEEAGKTLIEIKPDKHPIGVSGQEELFTTHQIQLEKGDCFYMFSDGYVDQFGGDTAQKQNKKGKKLKSKNFKRLILSLGPASMIDQQNALDEYFEAWRGRLEQVDDVCVIGVRL